MQSAALGRVRQFAALAICAAGCSTAIEGRTSFVGPRAVLEVRWKKHLVEDPLLEYKPQEFAAASSDGARVFVGSSIGKLFALATDDGTLAWEHKLDGAIAGRPRLVEELGALFVGTQAGSLYALDAKSGRELWRYQIKAPIESMPTYDGGVVYFTSGENRVYAVDARTGQWKWQYDREPPESFTIRGYPAPLVANGRVYAGFSDGYLACLSAGTGDVVWARSLAGDATRFMDVDGTPTLDGDTLYVSSYSGGVFALDPKDGSVKWQFTVEGAGSVRVRRGFVYFSAAKNGLYCLDAEGRLRWRQSMAAGGELSTPLVIGRYVVVSSASQGVYVADARDGRLYQYFAPGHGATAEPTTDGRQIYVLSNGGYFYAFTFAASTRT